MEYFLKLIVGLVNIIQTLLIIITKRLGFSFTDSELHFWVIGTIGIVFFLIADVAFKRLAKWSISIVTFIYTLTLLIVLVFSIEIEQRITGKGSMQFTDIVAGLWGFISVFSVYLLVIICSKLAGKIRNK